MAIKAVLWTCKFLNAGDILGYAHRTHLLLHAGESCWRLHPRPFNLLEHQRNHVPEALVLSANVFQSVVAYTYNLNLLVTFNHYLAETII